MTVYDSYGVAKTRGLCKVGGKVSVTRGSLCQAADLDLIRDRDDDIYIRVILRCWGNSSILCQQNSDAL